MLMASVGMTHTAPKLLPHNSCYQKLPWTHRNHQMALCILWNLLLPLHPRQPWTRTLEISFSVPVRSCSSKRRSKSLPITTITEVFEFEVWSLHNKETEIEIMMKWERIKKEIPDEFYDKDKDISSSKDLLWSAGSLYVLLSYMYWFYPRLIIRIGQRHSGHTPWYTTPYSGASN